MPANKHSSWHWRPLTPAQWGDFEQLFGPRGAYGGCWCMWWRITRREFEQLGFVECRRPSAAKVIMRYSFSTDD